MYGRLPRAARDVARASIGLTLAFAVGAVAGGELALAALEALALGVGYVVMARQRRSAKASACDGCPELSRGSVCSGYRRQSDAVRRWEEELTAAVLERGWTP